MTFRDRFYKYQTISRGLLNSEDLLKHFKKLSAYYKSRIGSYLPENLESKIIDIPCGYGNFIFFLKSMGYSNVTGFDLDGEQVRLANLLNLPAKKMDAFEILNKEDDFDVISSLDFLEHLTKDDALNFLDLCYAKLKIGGILILRTPCADGVFGSHDASNDITHEWNMSSNLMITILKMCGYSTVQVLDERPQPTTIFQFIRWLVYFPSKCFFNLFCAMIGLRPPKIITRSMIIIAYK